MAKKPETPETQTPEYAALAIRRRRISSGELPPLRAREIPLTGQKVPMQTWIFNTADDATRLYVAKTQRGWEHVTPKEIAGGLSGDMQDKNGVVVLGHRGEEYLMKMPLDEWRAIQQSKGERLEQRMRSKKHIVGGATKQLEREAGETDRSGAETLERTAGRMEGIELYDLNVGTERVQVGD